MTTAIEWSDVPGWPGFRASSVGELIGPSGRVLHAMAHHSGHLYVLHRVGGRMGKQAKLWVHRAVLLAFVGPCPDGMEARHLNGVPADNRRTNLAWGTPAENAEDKRRHGTLPVGERSGTAKLSIDAVVAIRQRHLEGEGVRALGRAFGVSHTQIRKIVAREAWAHV